MPNEQSNTPERISYSEYLRRYSHKYEQTQKESPEDYFRKAAERAIEIVRQSLQSTNGEVAE